MSPTDIEMCVVDCLLDDEAESLELILQAINDEDSASWRSARREKFSVEEVQEALRALIQSGLVTALAEQPPTYELQTVALPDVGASVLWSSLWFHLCPAGRQAFTDWWSNEGRQKYPRP